MLAMLTQADGPQNGAALIDALTTVLRNVTKEETVQYVLALLDDIVSSEPLSPQIIFRSLALRVGWRLDASVVFILYICCGHNVVALSPDG